MSEDKVDYKIEETDTQEEVIEISKDDWEIIVEALEDLDEESIEDVEDVLFRDRNIYIHDEISEETVDHIVPILHYYQIQDDMNELEYEEKVPVKVHLNTDGGCLDSSLLIAQEIKSSTTPVVTICSRKAFSGGLMIFMAGHVRVMKEFGVLMYHEARTGGYGVSGTFEEIDRSMEYYKTLQKLFDKLVIDGSNITQEQLDEHKGKVSDWYIDRDEAIKLGIIEE